MNAPKDKGVRMMRFEYRTLGQLIETVSVRGHQVKTDQYGTTGRWPIIDQGQSDIVGYTSAVPPVRGPFPMIVFGDHTKIVKRVDVPFVVGADGVKLLRPASEKIDAEYLFHLVRYAAGKILSNGYARHFSGLTEVDVPLADGREQRRIADILSTWDEALERLARQIERKEKLLGSIRERLIHGAHRVGGRNSPWPMTALSEVTRPLTKRNGNRYGRDLVMGVTKAEGIVPMREHVVAENISRYLILPPNGFAYNPMRINIGSIAMSEHEGDVIVSPDYVVFACKEDRLHPRFLNHLRRTKAWADFMTIAGNGSVRVRIYYASLAEFEFHLPPLDEQRAIVEVLDDGEREITALEAERAALARQRDALATELLTGRLRVPQVEAAS